MRSRCLATSLAVTVVGGVEPAGLLSPPLPGVMLTTTPGALRRVSVGERFLELHVGVVALRAPEVEVRPGVFGRRAAAAARLAGQKRLFDGLKKGSQLL